MKPQRPPQLQSTAENALALIDALAGFASSSAWGAAVRARHLAHRLIWDWPHSPVGGGWPSEPYRDCGGARSPVRHYYTCQCVPPCYGCRRC